MPLQVGSQIAHYEVTALIGEGGMGQVYQATDTKLNRQVALKILPEAFASDPDRLARFEREAQVLASLNHPGIAGIYGLEEQDGTKALVLELVEGLTLAERIAQGPIPEDEALPLARQIAEALEAAHEQGIIHRDLKPANVKLRPDGAVKVLDFGLAKSAERIGGDPSMSPTITEATGPGVILGTAAYMSPEQARGKSTDRRADIWAFGCVFYEMLTGARAFPGETVSDTVAGILDREPAWDALPAGLSVPMSRLLRRCLHKDARSRLRDIGDARVELEEGAATPSEFEGSGQRSPARFPWAWIGFAAVSLGVVVVSIFFGWNPRSEFAPVRDALDVSLPNGISLPPEMRNVMALSPNGRDLIFVGQRGASVQLYHRPSDEIAAAPLPDTSGASDPFFSPDGAWVGFVTGDSTRGGTLKRIRLDGSVSETVCNLPPDLSAHGMTWADDDTIWIGSRESGLYRVAASGGVPTLATMPDSVGDEGLGHHSPHALPGGRAILYSTWRGEPSSTSVGVYIVDSGEHHRLAAGTRAWFASSGHVGFTDEHGGNLWAVPFDLRDLVTTGEPVLLREGIRVTESGETQAIIGADGTLVYVPETSVAGTRMLVKVDRQGNERDIAALPAPYRWPRLSPDESRLAVEVAEGDTDIWIYDLVRGGRQRLIDEPGPDQTPLWTQDGEAVVFVYRREDQVSLGRKAADGTGEIEFLVSVPDRMLFPVSWSSDSQALLVSELDRAGSTGWNVGAVSMNEVRRYSPLVESRYDEGEPEISPDGRWLVYASTESGRNEIYVTNFPAMSERHQVSTQGGLHPVWSSAGDELFFHQPAPDCDNLNLLRCEKVLMAVAVNGEEQLELGPPEVLFSDPYYTVLGRNFDVTRDGGFIMIRTNIELRQITLVRHWVEELAERVPAP